MMENKIGIVGWGTDLSWLKMKTSAVVEKREKDKLKKTSPSLDEKDIGEKVSEKLRTYDFLGMRTKTVAPYEDDSTTYAVQSSYYALKRAKIDPKKIGLVTVGSETPPYKTGPTIAYHVATILGTGPQVWEEDISNACNGAMQAVRDAYFAVKSDSVEYGLGIGSDVARGAVGSPLEYAVGAGSSAWIIGKNAPITIRDIVPYTETRHIDIDFWVRENQKTPEVFGHRSMVCYGECILGALALLLMRHPKLSVSDFDYIVPHQPFNYMPIKTFKILDPSKKDQLKRLLKTALDVEDPALEKRMGVANSEMARFIMPGLIFSEIGNTYAASSQTGTCHVFNQAGTTKENGEPFFKKGSRILVLSYGSGTRAMALDLEVVDPNAVTKMVHRAPTTLDFLARMKYLNIGTYSANLKERIGKVRERLIHKRIIAEIEPVGSRMLYENICECESIFYPSRKEEWNEIFFSKGVQPTSSTGGISCMDTDCHGSQKTLSLPVKAKLKSAQKIPLRKALLRRMTTSYEILSKGRAIIVDTIFEKLYPGMLLTTRYKRLDYKGGKGLVQYGIAYAPPVPRLEVLKDICGDNVCYQDLLATLVKYPEQDLPNDEKSAYYAGVRALCIGNVSEVKENFTNFIKLLRYRKKLSEAELQQFIDPQVEMSTRIVDNAEEYVCKAKKYNKKISEID
ncbi:MAG: hypothetical protein ABIH76_00430 [Candidatus Bathyarchaeota archaeon]